MKHLKKFVFISLFLIFGFVLADNNPSPVVNVNSIKIDGRERRDNYEELISPGNQYDVDIIFENKGRSPVTINVGFVDGVMAVGSTPKRACKNDGEGEVIGNYILGNSVLSLNAGEKKTGKFTLQIPKENDDGDKYPYSGENFGCVVYSVKNMGDTDDGDMFSISVRKADFFDFTLVNSEDVTPPNIISLMVGNSDIFNGGATGNLPITSNITIKFSEPMDTKIDLSGILNHPFTSSWNDDGTILTIHPINNFSYSTVYNLFVDNRFRDASGNKLKGGKKYSFSTESNTNKPSGGGGGGGGTSFKGDIDNCPDGDFSTSLYDGSCGDYNEVENKKHGTAGDVMCSIAGSTYDDEMNQAYMYACNKRITTKDTIISANMNGPLLRKHLAKMISEFAIKDVGLKEDETRDCSNFSDIAGESQEMKYYIQLSCKLGLMGMESNGVDVKQKFDPNQYVTRAQFGTVLSRLLWGTTYATDDGSMFYEKHLQALKNNGIMTKIDGTWPKKIELRGYVMLMLMRTNEENLISSYNEVHGFIDSLLDGLKVLNSQSQVVMINEGNDVMYTSDDFVPLYGKIVSGDNIDSIYVSHVDSNGVGIYSNYKLEKFKPGDKKFVFYAYRYYNSLSVNDTNKYIFRFYDKKNKLVTEKTVIVVHDYKTK